MHFCSCFPCLAGRCLPRAGSCGVRHGNRVPDRTGKHSKYLSERAERLYGGQLVYKSSGGAIQVLLTLQTTFSGDLIGSFVGATRGDLGATAEVVLKNMGGYSGLLGLLTIIMLAYCVVKLFFANIKRGGILLCQIAVGSLYMFSIPRGFSDGFNGWCKCNFCHMSDGVFADLADVSGTADMADQYAAGTWNYACGE